MRYILLLFLSFSALSCCAQIDIINRTVTRRDSSFVFANMQNLVVITGTQKATFELKANHAQIKHADSAWLFMVETSRLGEDTFFIIRNKTLILTKIFKVIPEPPIKVRWGILQKDTATITEVIANRRMIMWMPGCNYCPGCRVFGFNIGFTTDNLAAKNKAIRIEGSELTENAANLISKLGHGDKVNFSFIVVGAFDARLREYPPFTIVIK